MKCSFCMERLCPHFQRQPVQAAGRFVRLQQFQFQIRKTEIKIMENGDNSIIFHLLDTYPIYLDLRKMLLFPLVIE